MSDYDNPYGMSEQEFEYRAMNPQDPMYMGDKYSSPYTPNDFQTFGDMESHKVSGEHHSIDENKGWKSWEFPKKLFFIILFPVLGLLIWVGLAILMHWY